MDINNKKAKRRKENGSVTLEASIALTIFIFLMLFMYSFLVVFEARNHVAHTMLAASNSLGFDSFATETVKESSAQELLYKLYGKMADSNGTYIDTSKWYDDEKKIQQTVKQRFLYYLSGGNEAEADRILKQLNIVGGFDGLDFSGCKVDGDDLYIEIKYTLDYEFKVFALDTMEMSHSCCSKLWK